MRLLNVFILVLWGLSWGSCTRELDLDEDTLLQMEKHAKMERLDEFYALAFTDPQRAETDFDRYVKTELITDRQNFLSDYEINNHYTLVTLAIRMTTNEIQSYEICDKNSLFSLYKIRGQTDFLNRNLLASIPQQLKQGARLQQFEERMASIRSFYDREIAAFRENSVADKRLTGTRWNYVGAAIKWDYSKVIGIRFDFTLNGDKSWDYESFFYMPAIPLGGLSSIIDEVELEKDGIASPPVYATYGDHICFYIELKNDYDPASETGKLARSWCYEYRYEVTADGVALSEPKILYEMFPQVINIEYDDYVFKTNYLDVFMGFDQPFVLTEA